MYQISKPKIHLSEINGYTNGTYIISKDMTFKDEKELVSFLAEYQRLVLNWYGNPISGEYNNVFMESQALTGIMRSSIFENPKELCKKIKDGWKLDKYLFWLDSPGRPNFDVRSLKDEVQKQHYENGKKKKKYKSRIEIRQDWLKRMRERQGSACHHNTSGRCDASYIHRARAAYGMLAEPEYKIFVKAKDKTFKSIWVDEDFSLKHHGTGWKESTKCKHQWEAKCNREYKALKHGDIAMFSGSAPPRTKMLRTQEELDEELEILQKELLSKKKTRTRKRCNKTITKDRQ